MTVSYYTENNKILVLCENCNVHMAKTAKRGCTPQLTPTLGAGSI